VDPDHAAAAVTPQVLKLSRYVFSLMKDAFAALRSAKVALNSALRLLSAASASPRLFWSIWYALKAEAVIISLRRLVSQSLVTAIVDVKTLLVKVAMALAAVVASRRSLAASCSKSCRGNT
jgi:hypothetical protein